MHTFWVVHADYGMAIKDYRTDDYNVARKAAIMEIGFDCFERIEEATEDDIEWVRAMGGRLPLAARKKA
jgi:hypothetical protein